MSGGVVSAFLESGVRFATPLAYAALGELVVERAGVINIGLEGAIIGGAFGALVFAGTGSVALGFVGAALAGTLVAALFAFFVVTLPRGPDGAGSLPAAIMSRMSEIPASPLSGNASFRTIFIPLYCLGLCDAVIWTPPSSLSVATAK